MTTQRRSLVLGTATVLAMAPVLTGYLWQRPGVSASHMSNPLPVPKPKLPEPRYEPTLPPEPLPVPQPAPSRATRFSETIRLRSAEGDRVKPARERAELPVRELFESAGVEYPAHELFLRAFKRERELEMWARSEDGQWTLITTYAIEGASGGPGPKRREGDGQVPEGFYEINRFNPQSSFHMSLGLNYPNEMDRILSDPEKPGYDIFIHGRNTSIGCLAVGDDRIEEIFLAAWDSSERPVRVHIFPARMDSPDWEIWRDVQIVERPELAEWWEELQIGWEMFERHGVVPKARAQPDGRHDFAMQ